MLDDVKDTSIHSLFIFGDGGGREEFCVALARLISTLSCRHAVHLRKCWRVQGESCEKFDMEHSLTALQNKLKCFDSIVNVITIHSKI